MNLIGQTKILTDYGRPKTCLKFWIAYFPNFKILLKIWLLTKFLFPPKGGWFLNSTHQRNASVSAPKFSNFVTWLDTRVTRKYTCGRTDSARHSMWQQPMRQWQLTRKTEGCGHKLKMDNFFSSPELFGNLVNKQIYCCGTVRPNRKGTSQDLVLKTRKLRRGDIHVRTRADLMAILWQDKRDVCKLTNIHNAPAEGNFCNEKAKPQNHKLWWIITIIWAIWIRVTEWPTVTPSASTHLSGWKNCSFIC